MPGPLGYLLHQGIGTERARTGGHVGRAGHREDIANAGREEGHAHRRGPAQRALELACARLGLATEEVEVTPGQRPVMQIVGIDRRLRAAFAQRSHAVRTMAESLFDAYRRRHGRQPAGPVRTRLQWQATIKTRPPKRQARSLDDLLADWRRRAIAATDETVVDNLLVTARAAAGERPAPAAFDSAAAAEEVLAAVTERRTTFRRHVLAEARRYLMRTLGGATAASQAAEQITDRVLAHGDCLNITPPALNPPHPDLQHRDGTSVHRPIGATTYTTRSLLAAENRLLAAARTRVIPPVAPGTFHRVAALGRSPMDAGQRALASSFVLSDRLLLAGLGPAGAGKTTAMKLVARAVDAAGGRLVPLAPSARAAKVLGGDLQRRAHTLHSWPYQRGRAAHGTTVDDDFQLRRGDVVLVDEAGMAGTLLLDAILADATAACAVVRLLGDPHQLAAVEAGGALRLVSRTGDAVELDQLHRFSVPGEADASLILRDSEEPRAVFDWYCDKGRIVAGTHDTMCDMVFNAWAKDQDKGLTSLMTAADTATVTALNLRAQAHHITAGIVDTRHAAPLRAGQRAHAGDIIVTRLNRRRMTVRGGRDFVKNGDTWTVQKILPTGDALVRHTQHRSRIPLPADYLAAQCELGYASTIHRSQGMTVDTSHAIASARSNREGVYVQLTRGARTNRLYVALEDGDGLDDVLAQIAARRRAQLSATESIAALQQEIVAPGRLSVEFADVAERATTARLTGLLEHALGADRAAMFMAADAYPALIRALHDAERAGFDLSRLLTGTVPRRGFTDADDPAAVLTWRLRERLKDAATAQQEDRVRPLAELTLTQLHTLTKLAAAHRAAAARPRHHPRRPHPSRLGPAAYGGPVPPRTGRRPGHGTHPDPPRPADQHTPVRHRPPRDRRPDARVAPAARPELARRRPRGLPARARHHHGARRHLAEPDPPHPRHRPACLGPPARRSATRQRPAPPPRLGHHRSPRRTVAHPPRHHRSAWTGPAPRRLGQRSSLGRPRRPRPRADPAPPPHAPPTARRPRLRHDRSGPQPPRRTAPRRPAARPPGPARPPRHHPALLRRTRRTPRPPRPGRPPRRRAPARRLDGRDHRPRR
ncbi:AAA family ATPase [Streptomyces werraensis]|uniref:AAA family ATPase n=1 Tax=Streptomyces werraensis TaxID=68284 RepID=UPI0034144D83